MPTRLFPISYDFFKALVAIVLIILLWWLWPGTEPPTLNAAVDPSGAVTLDGKAQSGKTVQIAITDASGKVSRHSATADDSGRWLTAVELEPGTYTAVASIGSSSSDAIRFTVPKPAQLAPLSIDPVPSPTSSPLTLSGRAEPGHPLLFFVDGRPVPTDPPITAGPDGRWSLRLEAPPGGHTIYVAYADAPERVSDPLTIEVRPPAPVVEETVETAPAAPEEPAETEAEAEAETEIETEAPTPEPSPGQAYVVQEGDWLSKLAEEYLGDAARYPEIREATNARAAKDDSFATIEDDHLIYPGEKIWIPAP